MQRQLQCILALSKDDVFADRVVGLFQKPADCEDASTPENKFDALCSFHVALTFWPEKNGKWLQELLRCAYLDGKHYKKECECRVFE